MAGQLLLLRKQQDQPVVLKPTPRGPDYKSPYEKPRIVPRPGETPRQAIDKIQQMPPQQTLEEFEKNLYRVTNEYKKFKEQINDRTLKRLSNELPVFKEEGPDETLVTPTRQTTFKELGQDWRKWGQENPIARTVVGSIPVLGQLAAGADVAAAVSQGDYEGAARGASGFVPGGAGKILRTGTGAIDAARNIEQGQYKQAATSALGAASMAGSTAAQKASSAISKAQTIANAPDTIKSAANTAQKLPGMIANAFPNTQSTSTTSAGQAELKSPTTTPGTASGSVKVDENAFRKLINIVESTNKSCPIATYNIDVNLKNRQKAIDEYHYGPANPDKPENYWRDLAAIWKIKEATAKTMKCENCGAFDVSDDMRKCIEDGIRGDDNKIADARAPIDLADLGYCTFLKFKCAGSRSCSAFIVGGPITKD
jgi:hypothetical protein